tara:strand:+ start:832 stop:966 length:135 start_codon:yes stop_codon:yes gene_type:complete
MRQHTFGKLQERERERGKEEEEKEKVSKKSYFGSPISWNTLLKE